MPIWDWLIMKRGIRNGTEISFCIQCGRDRVVSCRDCRYRELSGGYGKYAESAKYFEKAAKVSDNAVFSPIYLKKAAAAYEKVGNNEAAVKLYQEIKDKYPTSNDARGIERYIERAQNK